VDAAVGCLRGRGRGEEGQGEVEVEAHGAGGGALGGEEREDRSSLCFFSSFLPRVSSPLVLTEKKKKTQPRKRSPSPSQISAALAKFGLSDGARHLLVARFVDDGDRDDKADEDEASAGAAFAAAVRGTRVPAAEVEAELASVSDAAAQIGAFKIAMSAAAAEREEGGEEGGGGGERGGGERGGGGGERGGGERGGGGARGPRRGAAAAAAGRGGAGGGEVGPLSAAVACRIALRDC